MSWSPPKCDRALRELAHPALLFFPKLLIQAQIPFPSSPWCPGHSGRALSSSLFPGSSSARRREILLFQVPRCFPGYHFLAGKVEASELHPQAAAITGQSKKTYCCLISFGKHCARCAAPEQTAWARAEEPGCLEESSLGANTLPKKQSSAQIAPQDVLLIRQRKARVSRVPPGPGPPPPRATSCGWLMLGRMQATAVCWKPASINKQQEQVNTPVNALKEAF